MARFNGNPDDIRDIQPNKKAATWEYLGFYYNLGASWHVQFIN